MVLLCKESADFRHKSINYGIFHLQKYTFSLKRQINGEEFHALTHGIRFINDFYRTH